MNEPRVAVELQLVLGDTDLSRNFFDGQQRCLLRNFNVR